MKTGSEKLNFKQFRAQWIKSHPGSLKVKDMMAAWRKHSGKPAGKPKKAPKTPEPSPEPEAPQRPEKPVQNSLTIGSQPDEITVPGIRESDQVPEPATAPGPDPENTGKTPANAGADARKTAQEAAEGYKLLADGLVTGVDLLLPGMGVDVRMTEEERKLIPDALAQVLRKYDTEGTMLENAPEFTLLCYSTPYLIRAVPAVFKRFKKAGGDENGQAGVPASTENTP